MIRKLVTFLIVIALCPSITLAAHVDDCHAGFNAYVGAKPYILNPAAADRSETRLVAVFENTETDVGGAVPWRMTIRSVANGQIVATRTGSLRVEPRRQAGVEATWDGRTPDGAFVADGEYIITATAYFLSGEPRTAIEFDAVDPSTEGTPVAVSSDSRIVVDRAGRYDVLFDEVARQSRLRQANATGGIAGFPYDFYFGVFHSHSSWSDGGMPTSDCTSGRYGYAGGATPADAFDYAKTSGSIDFLAVNEHNHLMQEACSGCSAADVINRYATAWTAAQNATVPGSFVGLWGMEWGVISGGGHLNIYNQQQLMSWTGEPFDVETPKSNYTSLYTALATNQGALGSYGTFNHPNSSDFGNWQRTPEGDAVMRGLSVVSGPAFSTSTSFTPGGSTYTSRFNQALSQGWKIAPEAHQDNHCWNYGNSTPNRTVAVVPSGATFDQSSLVGALGDRRFYASQDRDAQLRFGTSDNAFVMGESFAASSAVGVTAGVFDPAAEGVQKIEIWGGRAGTNASPGASPTVVSSNLGSDSLVASLATQTAGEEWYYYVVAVQADGDTLWSAPIWITWNGGGGGGDTTPPSTSITSPAPGATLSGTTTVTASATDDVAILRVEFRLDGALVSTDSVAPYEWTWNTTTATNGAHTIVSRAVDTSNNTADSAPVSVTVSNSGGGSGTSADVSGWILEQANASYQFVIPAGTTIPAGGYLVIARNATQAAFESYWGTTLGANALFLSAGNQMAMNGSETYTLRDAASAIVDGPSIAMGGSGGQSLNRTDYCGSASSAASWNVISSASGSPGTNGATGCNAGVRISEFSDATGTGNYVYEFVEIYNDSTSGGGGDTTAPTTSITSPASSATVSGTVSVTASASDDTGVTSVAFYLDGALAATDTTAPYSWSWNTTGAANGSHSLSSRAYDAAGNSGDSAIVNVTVANDTTAPTTSITSPASGTTVSGTVSVTASASDDTGVTSVEFYLDGALVATDTTAPYSWSWDTTASANGNHTLTSRAFDATGNSGDSAAVSVTVGNDTTAPTTSITSPASGATVSGTISVTASASDDTGVASVEFFLDGVLVATDTTAPYSWSWDTTAAADGSHSLTSRAYDAAGNTGDSAAVTVTVVNAPVVTGTDISGWSIVQANSSATFDLPAGTIIPTGGYLVIGRNATQQAFETYWRVTLGANVVYINSGDSMPLINGSEKYTLYDSSGRRQDGATLAMSSSAGESLQRRRQCGNAGKSSSWYRLDASQATPGSGALAPCGKGIYIGEFADAPGTGNYVYEFIELIAEN